MVRASCIMSLMISACFIAASPGQTPAYPIPAPSTQEPPAAEPGEFRQAPEESVVTPGQPRTLPNLNARNVDFGQPGANHVPDSSSGIQPAQYVYPSPAPQPRPTDPMVLHAEPPTPSVRISVRGSEVAPTNQEITYKLTATNASEARAHSVVVKCPIPKGARLVKTMPEAETVGKELEWKLETLEPASTRVMEVVFKPEENAGEIMVIAKVQFEHGRYVRTKIEAPALQIKKTGPAQAVLHEPIAYKILVKNPGRVPVTDTQVVNSLPDGMEYVQETSTTQAAGVSKVGPGANQRTWNIGTVQPGETRTLEYRVLPRKTGELISEAVATGTGVQVKAGANTIIQEARLSLQLTGPANEKGTAGQATPYLIAVHNTGTATLHNVRVYCGFPAEVRLGKVSSGGHLYKDGAQWVLPKLEPNETKELALSLIAPSAGTRELTASVRADHGLEQKKKVSTAFEGVASLNWKIDGTAIAAVGQEITYTITLKNPGSAMSKNVKVVADLPNQVEFAKAEPGFQRGPNAVFFKALEIPPRESVTLKVVAIAKKAGEARFQFELSSEGMSTSPLKTTKSTSISPSGDPKKADPLRIATEVPLDMKPMGDASIMPAVHSEPKAASATGAAPAAPVKKGTQPAPAPISPPVPISPPAPAADR